jgi:hypothetical protein
MSDFGEGKWVKTRRAHRCEWCGEGIDVGSRAYRYCGMYDGEWQNWGMHEECLDVYALNGYEEFSPYEGERPKHNESVPDATGHS